MKNLISVNEKWLLVLSLFVVGLSEERGLVLSIAESSAWVEMKKPPEEILRAAREW